MLVAKTKTKVPSTTKAKTKTTKKAVAKKEVTKVKGKAGRPPGAKNKVNRLSNEQRKILANKEDALTSYEFLQSVMHDTNKVMGDRIDAAKQLLPYQHRRMPKGLTPSPQDQITPIFPSDYCKLKLATVKLLPNKELCDIAHQSSKDKAIQDIAKAARFQNIALFGNYEEAVLVYDDVKLTEPQDAALKLVYSATKNEALATMAGKLNDFALDNPSDTPKVLGQLYNQIMGIEEDMADTGISKTLRVIRADRSKKTEH